MKTKKIVLKLEELFGKSFAKKSKKKQLKSLNKIVGMLEAKEAKFRQSLADATTQTDTSKYQRKIDVTLLHITKAKAYQQELNQK